MTTLRRSRTTFGVDFWVEAVRDAVIPSGGFFLPWSKSESSLPSEKQQQQMNQNKQLVVIKHQGSGDRKC